MQTKKETFRDKYFFHRSKDKKTLWFHLNRLEIMFSFRGLCLPALELWSGNGDYVIGLTVNLGLFGFTIGTSKMFFMRRDGRRCARLTGFSFNREHFVISFYHNTDNWADDWRGWEYCLNLDTLFRGERDNITIGEPITETIVTQSIARRGFPVEDVTLEITCSINQVTRTRWYNEDAFKCWTVNVVPANARVLRVPGKGENGWDQDDSYGLDLYMGNQNIMTAQEAAAYAMKHIDDLRDRRGY